MGSVFAQTNLGFTLERYMYHGKHMEDVLPV